MQPHSQKNHDQNRHQLNLSLKTRKYIYLDRHHRRLARFMCIIKLNDKSAKIDEKNKAAVN